MKTEEAKAILHSYRPNGSDAADPAFQEALKLAGSDPALKRWFANQQAFDRVMASEYDALKAPPGLLDAILAAAPPAAEPAPEVARPGWWRRAWPMGLAAAAGLALIVSSAFLLRPAPAQLAAHSTLADFVIGDAQLPKTHGGRGAEAAALNKMLNQPATRLSDPLPVDVASLKNSGGRTVSVEGRPVIEVCFRRNGVGLHCYVARREDFPTLTAPPKPTVTDRETASIATWADSANLYIVVTKPGREALEKLL